MLLAELVLLLLPFHWLPKAGSDIPLGKFGLSVSGYCIS